jgi:hypothetical protein
MKGHCREQSAAALPTQSSGRGTQVMNDSTIFKTNVAPVNSCGPTHVAMIQVAGVPRMSSLCLAGSENVLNQNCSPISHMLDCHSSYDDF